MFRLRVNCFSHGVFYVSCVRQCFVPPVLFSCRLVRLSAKGHHHSSEGFAQGHANILRSRLSRGERKLVRQEGTFMSSFGQVLLDRRVRLHDATLRPGDALPGCFLGLFGQSSAMMGKVNKSSFGLFGPTSAV
ncbi:hypothetical protein NPIL_239991 [Nephila pilipes]|uniref:Uncharacterized protein n=1 Tax=Nephila pilipes TaxID=299642 RepID=A0A8X6R176_NEPPI|nr:hypothetical protein NPIL_239991 [Nephila pilipes]